MENYLYQHLIARHEQSDNTFLLLEDDTTISFREFCQRINQFAGSVSELGVNPGDRVAVQVNKSWHAVALYLGVIKAGGVFLPLNNAYTPAEIGYFIENATPSVFVCDDSALSSIREITSNTNTTLLSLNADGNGSLTKLADDHSLEFDAVSRGEHDLAAILYTSGTTGRSKGAMLSHGNLWSNAQVLTSAWEFTRQDVLLHALPIFHTHGLFVATNTCLVSGAKMILLPGFNIEQMLKKLPHATSMMGVPTFYTRLLEDSRFNADLVNHMRLFISGSAPLLAETHIEFEQRTGHRILERYGMTETNMNTSNPLHGDRRPGTVGPALPGVSIRVISTDTKQPVAAGEIGSIQVKGPNVFSGYWKMPEKTAEEFTEDGFFITGDLGMLSEDHYLSIVGRSKDLIISGGYNIYPKELELILDDLPGVGESAVIGIPHPDFGEGVVAVLTGDNPPDENQIRSLLKDQVARFKQPKRVFHVEALPRNAMGKVQKNILRQQYAHCFAA